jgi:hypothetical protein
MDKERRQQICDKWNNETKYIREFVSRYIEQFMKDNNISQAEWEELHKDPHSGEMI